MQPQDIVRAYYPKVDAGDVEWVINLFAETGVYERADAVYDGKAAIADFYRGDRKIRGRHSLENIVADGDTIIVNGVFEGFGADDSPKKIAFADAWKFDDAGKVASRKTYLAIGADYVKD